MEWRNGNGCEWTETETWRTWDWNWMVVGWDVYFFHWNDYGFGILFHPYPLDDSNSNELICKVRSIAPKINRWKNVEM